MNSKYELPPYRHMIFLRVKFKDEVGAIIILFLPRKKDEKNGSIRACVAIKIDNKNVKT